MVRTEEVVGGEVGKACTHLNQGCLWAQSQICCHAEDSPKKLDHQRVEQEKLRHCVPIQVGNHQRDAGPRSPRSTELDLQTNREALAR